MALKNQFKPRVGAGRPSLPTTVGFSAASPDATAVAPRRKEGLLSPSQEQAEDVLDPIQAVDDEFSGGLGLDVEETGGNVSFEVPTFVTPQREPFRDPTFGRLSELIEGVEGQPPPLPRPVPGEISPLQTFLATFAASMASQVARNPNILENIQRRIQNIEERRQAILENNRLEEMAFSGDKRQQILQLRLAALERGYNEAVKDNDWNNAQKSLKALEEFRGELLKEETLAKESGETKRARLQLLGRVEKSEDKTVITLDKLQERLGQASIVDPDKIAVEGAGKTGFFSGDLKVAASQIDLLIETATTGVLKGADNETKSFALGRLQNYLGIKHDIKWEGNPNPRKLAAVGNDLVKLGFDKNTAKNFVMFWLGGVAEKEGK